jgi:hypothetical protein
MTTLAVFVEWLLMDVVRIVNFPGMTVRSFGVLALTVFISTAL